MKLLDLKCPHCGASLKVNSGKKTITCEFCNASLVLDDETLHIKYDNAEEAGYLFEKGRQRAKNEKKAFGKNTNVNTKPISKTRILVECALMVALAIVLDLIPMPKWPNGGSLSIAAVPIIFISYRHGLLWGLSSGLVYSVVQMITGFYPPPAGTFLGYVGVVLLDYVLAFTAFGLADLFAEPFGRRRLVGYGVGAVCVNLIRFLCSFLSGWIIWGVYAPEGQAPWLYSLLYNGGYMLPNAILCAVVIVLLCLFVNPKTLRPTKK